MIATLSALSLPLRDTIAEIWQCLYGTETAARRTVWLCLCLLALAVGMETFSSREIACAR